MPSQPKTSAGRALFWSGADALLRNGATFVGTVVLTRLLRPEDFGTLAALQIFTGVASVFVDSGLTTSLVRNPESTRSEESNAFYFNVAVAGLLALLMVVSAPWIAAFFGASAVHGLIYVMALNLFIGAFGAIHNALLTRALDFRTLAKIGVVANTAATLLAIFLAYRGFGVWSLAYQVLAATCLTTLLQWKLHAWRPVGSMSLAPLRKNLRFGSYVLLTSLMGTLDTQLNTVLIAKLFSRRDLGFYTRAQGTQQLPAILMTKVLNRVALPVFSAAAKERARLVNGMRRAQGAAMWLNVPAMLGLAVLAEPLVVTLFGARWLPCATLLQPLALVGLFRPLHVFNLNVLLAQGRSDLFFRVDMTKRLVAVVLTVLASFHGVLAMAWAQVLSALLAFAINAHYTGRLLGYGAGAQLRDLAPYWGLALPMAAALWGVRAWLDMPALVALLVLPLLGAAMYLVASWRLRLPAFNEVAAMVVRRKSPV